CYLDVSPTRRSSDLHILGRHFKMTNHVIIGYVYLGITVGQTGNRRFHIGLPGRQPHIANEDMTDDNFVDLHDIGPSCRLRRQLHFPSTILACLGIILLSLIANGYFLAYIGPAPNIEGNITLQNHLVANELGKTYFGHDTVSSQKEETKN